MCTGLARFKQLPYFVPFAENQQQKKTFKKSLTLHAILKHLRVLN